MLENRGAACSLAPTGEQCRAEGKDGPQNLQYRRIRTVASWQMKRQAAISIERVPGLFMALLADSAMPENACLARAVGSSGESSAANNVRVYKAQKKNALEIDEPML